MELRNLLKHQQLFDLSWQFSATQVCRHVRYLPLEQLMNKYCTKYNVLHGMNRLQLVSAELCLIKPPVITLVGRNSLFRTWRNIGKSCLYGTQSDPPSIIIHHTHAP